MKIVKCIWLRIWKYQRLNTFFLDRFFDIRMAKNQWILWLWFKTGIILSEIDQKFVCFFEFVFSQNLCRAWTMLWNNYCHILSYRRQKYFSAVRFWLMLWFFKWKIIRKSFIRWQPSCLYFNLSKNEEENTTVDKFLTLLNWKPLVFYEVLLEKNIFDKLHVKNVAEKYNAISTISVNQFFSNSFSIIFSVQNYLALKKLERSAVSTDNSWRIKKYISAI